MLYYFVGTGMNLLFEDELAEFDHLSKNIICGAITGAIYKSTLGKYTIFIIFKELYHSLLEVLLVEV